MCDLSTPAEHSMKFSCQHPLPQSTAAGTYPAHSPAPEGTDHLEDPVLQLPAHIRDILPKMLHILMSTKMNPTQVVWRDARSIIITVSSGEVRLILMSLMKMKPTSYHRFCFHTIFLLCFINKILLAASHGTQRDHHRSSTVDTVIHERLFGTFM